MFNLAEKFVFHVAPSRQSHRGALLRVQRMFRKRRAMTARKHLGRVSKSLPLCRAIRGAREENGMSQAELSRRLAVSQSMVARWESNSEPLLSVAVRIERVLGLPRGDLLRSAGYVSDVVSVGRAIEEDPRLDERARRVLLASYRSLTRADGKVG